MAVVFFLVIFWRCIQWFAVVEIALDAPITTHLCVLQRTHYNYGNPICLCHVFMTIFFDLWKITINRIFHYCSNGIWNARKSGKILMCKSVEYRLGLLSLLLQSFDVMISIITWWRNFLFQTLNFSFLIRKLSFPHENFGNIGRVPLFIRFTWFEFLLLRNDEIAGVVNVLGVLSTFIS